MNIKTNKAKGLPKKFIEFSDVLDAVKKAKTPSAHDTSNKELLPTYPKPPEGNVTVYISKDYSSDGGPNEGMVTIPVTDLKSWSSKYGATVKSPQEVSAYYSTLPGASDKSKTIYDEAIAKGKDPALVRRLISSKDYKDINEFNDDYTMLHGSPVERMILALTGSDIKAPEFNDAKTKELMDAYIASLEDPFNQSMQDTLANLNARGLLGSGIQQEQIGRLMTGYQGAKEQEANALTGDVANKQVNVANEKYTQNVDTYLAEIENLWKNSNEDWDTFYEKNKALIDSKLSGYASDKGIAYEQAVSDYNSGQQDFLDTINSTASLFGAIGGLGADYFATTKKTNTPLTTSVMQPYNTESNLTKNVRSAITPSGFDTFTNPWEDTSIAGGKW